MATDLRDFRRWPRIVGSGAAVDGRAPWFHGLTGGCLGDWGPRHEFALWAKRHPLWDAYFTSLAVQREPIQWRHLPS